MNSQTGVVVLAAVDVGADPAGSASTAQAAAIAAAATDATTKANAARLRPLPMRGTPPARGNPDQLGQTKAKSELGRSTTTARRASGRRRPLTSAG